MSYSMDLQQKQAPSLKQMQRLIMSPQMQQAISLLQMPVMELSSMVEAELEQNPVLETAPEEQLEDPEAQAIESEVEEEIMEKDLPLEQELSFHERDFEILKQIDEEFRDHFAESGTYVKRTSEEDKLKTFLENSICANDSFFEGLMKQAKETFESPEEVALAELIIGNLDETGFFTQDIGELAILHNVEAKKLQAILEQIQKFEPYGIGAANLQESLLIQLKAQGKGNTLAFQIIKSHFDDLLHNRIPVIQKKLGRSLEEIRESIEKHIAKLDLHPGASLAETHIQPVIPDVSIKQEGDNLLVVINDEGLPPLKLNARYLRMLDDKNLPVETKDFIRHKIVSARWLLKNIYQRNDTIERIAQSLATRQKDFFFNPQGKLVPLTMKVIAEELGLHESTIARAVANKYIDTPRGVIALRSFFTNAYLTEEGEDMSSKTVRDVLRDIIHNEDKRKPLSDEVISRLLKEKGIPCARRTVAKYRTAMNIGNTQQRKKF